MENQNNVNGQNKSEEVVLAEGKATTSMVLGIVSLVISTVVGIICGAIAMKKANEAKKVIPNSSTATAGYITGLIGLILGIIFTAVIALAIIAGMAAGASSGIIIEI